MTTKKERARISRARAMRVTDPLRALKSLGLKPGKPCRVRVDGRTGWHHAVCSFAVPYGSRFWPVDAEVCVELAKGQFEFRRYEEVRPR